MPPLVIAVTGATGNVGRPLVSELARAGHQVRAVTRHPDPGRLPEGVEAFYGDLDDPSSLNAALEGSDAAFLLWPSTSADGVDNLVRVLAGRVARVVYLSSMGARGADGRRTEPVAFHARVEAAIRDVNGLDWAFIRPSGFATNTYMWLGQILTSDVVRFPFARCGRSLIHEADIAAVAARVLTTPSPSNEVHLLTGPEVLTHAEQVRIIGETIGRPLRFEESPPEQGREELIAAWGDAQFVDTAMEAWREFEEEPEMVTDTVRSLLGRPAQSFQQWTQDHISAFGGRRPVRGLSPSR